VVAEFNFESASGDTQADRCRMLWAAVLAQVLSDAFGESRRPIAESEQTKARSFCLADSGQWAKEREVVCALAGIDPAAFREKVLALHEAGRLSDRKVSA
jgi:hypothetical protein